MSINCWTFFDILNSSSKDDYWPKCGRGSGLFIILKYIKKYLKYQSNFVVTIMSVSKKKESQIDRVDHGYAWVMILVVFLWNVICAAVFKCLGVLHIQIKELFGESSFKTSLVAFVMTICWVVFSPIGGYLTYRWSDRITTCIGAFIASGKYLHC